MLYKILDNKEIVADKMNIDNALLMIKAYLETHENCTIGRSEEEELKPKKRLKKAIVEETETEEFVHHVSPVIDPDPVAYEDVMELFS